MSEREDPPTPSTEDPAAQGSVPDGTAASATEQDWEDLSARAAAADALRAEVAALEDRLKRAQADFLNETRRIRAQAEAERPFAVRGVLLDLIPVADALYGAAGSFPPTEEGRRQSEGYALIVRQFEDVLARHGIRRIDAAGKPFDPAAHEALAMVDRDDVPAQTVVEVVRPGFTLHDRVVRAAQVVVSRAPPAADPPSPDPQGP